MACYRLRVSGLLNCGLWVVDWWNLSLLMRFNGDIYVVFRNAGCQDLLKECRCFNGVVEDKLEPKHEVTRSKKRRSDAYGIL